MEAFENITPTTFNVKIKHLDWHRFRFLAEVKILLKSALPEYVWDKLPSYVTKISLIAYDFRARTPTPPHIKLILLKKKVCCHLRFKAMLAVLHDVLGPFLSTWVNFNPNMDK